MPFPEFLIFVDVSVDINGGTPSSLEALFHGKSQKWMMKWGTHILGNFHLLMFLFLLMLLEGPFIIPEFPLVMS